MYVFPSHRFIASQICDHVRVSTCPHSGFGVVQISFYGYAACCGSMVESSGLSYIIRRADSASVRRISSERAQPAIIIRHLQISPLHSLSCMLRTA